MYKIRWDKDINGILLDDKTDEKATIVPPRPVFFEELDLLGFDKHWKYPKSEAPLLWSAGRRYYYRGEFVAEAKGGDIYTNPELITHYKGDLEPIDIESVIKKNREALFTLENEAIDFVEHIHKVYKQKVDYFTVAFSGGKDSQVVLDIVSRVLAPEDFLTIFTNTGMEIPFTYTNVEKTENVFKKAYRDFKIHTANPPGDTLTFWEKFGPPSRIQRWCCIVCKTAPYADFLRSYHKSIKENGQPGIMVFEGVRSDESNKRRSYKRIVTDLKHLNQINARIILNWNVSEIFLYIFARNLLINEGYRFGLHRIGCSICPFARGWSEFIIHSIFPDLSRKFIQVIESNLKISGISTNKAIKKYIQEQQWKKRGGGNNLTSNSGIDLINQSNNLKAVIRHPRENYLEWLKTLGRTYYDVQGTRTVGEIVIKDRTYQFSMSKSNAATTLINLNNVEDIIVLSKIKKILYKTAYCVHCGACQVECPTGALQVTPQLKIDSHLCIHCAHCLNHVDKGCLLAKSLTESKGDHTLNSKYSNPDRYSGFGITQPWLESFINTPEKWLEKNPSGLGPKQLKAMITWLKEAELLDSYNNLTQLSVLLSNNKNEIRFKLLWEIVWINLCHNSNIVKWYSKLSYQTYKREELHELLKNDFPQYSDRTITNALKGLIYMYDKSPIGNDLKQGVLVKKGNATKLIQKIGCNNISSASVAYSLYKYAEKQRRYDLTVSELYTEESIDGPFREFGVERQQLENSLRAIQLNKDQFIRVELNADLDNIFLREEFSSFEMIKAFLDR